MPETKWRNPGQTEVGESGVVAIAMRCSASQSVATNHGLPGTLAMSGETWK